MKKKLNVRSLLSLVAWVVVFILLLIVPGKLNNYQLTIVNVAIIYFIVCMAYTVMLGMGGMMSMAHVTFMGFGAFFTANLAKNFGVPTLLAGLIAVAATALLAFILSIMLVRLEGFYFVFGTIGLCNMMATVFLNFRPLTNGADGISGIPKLNLFGFEVRELRHWCLLLCLVAFVIALIVARIRKTSLGRSLMSIRDNPVAAETLGVNVRRTKRIAFTIGATFAATAGMLIAFHNGVVSASLFTSNIQQNMLMMTMLGGVNSTVGALGGAFLVQLMPEVLRPIQEYLRLVQGVMLILLMIFMPMGIAGLVQSGFAKIKKAIAKKKGGAEIDAAEVAESSGR